MLENSPALIQSFLDHQSLGTLVLYALAFRGFLEILEWSLIHFVNWTHRIRLLWRKFRSEPIPDAASH